MRRIDPEMTRRARELRNNATPAERRLWRLLSRYRPPFTRQLIEGPFILDLACREARLAVEVDGGQHAESDADARRTTWLEGEGWTVIRFWNNEVRDNPHAVADMILAKVAECLGDTHPHGKGEPAPGRFNAVRVDSATLSILPSREGRIRVPRFPD